MREQEWWTLTYAPSPSPTSTWSMEASARHKGAPIRHSPSWRSPPEPLIRCRRLGEDAPRRLAHGPARVRSIRADVGDHGSGGGTRRVFGGAPAVRVDRLRYRG